MATAIPTNGPPPLTMSMIRGIANQPAMTTTRITAEAMSGPARVPEPCVKARTRRPARW